MIKNLAYHKSFIVNAGAMFSGAAVARGLSFLAAPVIARLFSPEDFGVAAVFALLVLLADPCSTFLFENASIVEKDEDKSNGLFLLSLFSLLTFCLLSLFTILLLSFTNVRFSLLDDLGLCKYILPPAILIYGFTKIINSWNVRHKKFKAIAYAEVVQTGLMVLSRIGFGIITGSTVLGLILGYLLGIVAKGWVLIKDPGICNLQKIFKKGEHSLKSLAYEYKDFVFYASPLRLMRVMANNLPVLMLSYIYSPAIVGFYALTNRLIRNPVNIFQKSLGQTYFQKASEVYNSGRIIRPSLMKTTGALLMIGLPVCITVLAVGEELTTLLLGEEWQTTGRYIEILAPWFMTTLLVSPANSVFVIVKKQQYLFVTDIIGLIAKCSVFGVAYGFKLDAETTIFWFMIASISNEILIMIQSFFFSGIRTSIA